MVEQSRLIAHIDGLREELYSLIQEKHYNLLDPDVQSACRALNNAINEYTRFYENQIKVLK